jgi:hypothetical protein
LQFTDITRPWICLAQFQRIPVILQICLPAFSEYRLT